MAEDTLKKVLYIHHSGNLGGAPLSLSYLLKSIDRTTYQPALINVSEGPANEIFNNVNVEPQVLKGTGPFHGSTVANMNLKVLIKNLFYLLPSLYKGYKAIRSFNPDLIHLNSTCLFPFAIAAKLFNRDLPVLCHVREPICNNLYGWPLRHFTKRYVDGVIAISEFDLNSLHIDQSDSIKSKIVYNFVDSGFLNSENKEIELRSKLGIKNDDVVFLYLARFSDGNGWKELINYAEKVIERKNNCHFILAGAHTSLDKKKYEMPNVHILEFQKDVTSLLSCADIYVCPFTEPHFARGVIEASAWGIPILANDIGGVNELVEDLKTGYLYDNRESFLAHSLKLIQSPDIRRKLGEAGMTLVNEKFSYENNTKQTFEYYEKFL